MQTIQLTLFPEERSFSIIDRLTKVTWDDYLAILLRMFSSCVSTSAIVMATTVRSGQSDKKSLRTTIVTKREGRRYKGDLVRLKGTSIQGIKRLDTVKDEPVFDLNKYEDF